MSSLGENSDLAFPLGGDDDSAPFITNLNPRQDEAGAGLTEYVRFSVRDTETYVDPSTLQVIAGYARTRAVGDEPFEDSLDRTFLSSVLSGPVDDEKADRVPSSNTLQITKTKNGPQESVYFTALSADEGYESVLLSISLLPDTISTGEQGAVIGIENGPRQTGVYVFFDDPGTKRIRMVGPADASGTRSPDLSVDFDWSSAERSYVLVWNEASEKVELYDVGDVTTSLIISADISAFQTFDTELGSPTPQRGKINEVLGIYGVEGPVGEQVSISKVAFTQDVKNPFIGISRTGYFYTVRRSDETIRYEGDDPRSLNVSPWFPPDDEFFTNPDPQGSISVLDDGSVRNTKVTTSGTHALYREEPGFLTSNSNGIFLESTFFAIPSQVLSSQITGMGFLIWDGATAFVLQLMAGTTRNLGILKAGGSIGAAYDYNIPSTPIDWSSAASFRFVADPRRNKVELYSADDLVTPVLSADFDRSDFPDGTTLGIDSYPPFIAFGHIADLATAGSMDVSKLVYNHLYQAYEAKDGYEPDDIVNVDPSWSFTTEGFQDFGPLWGHQLLGGGMTLTPLGYFNNSGTYSPTGSASIASEQLALTTDPGETLTYHRPASLDSERGAVLEARLQITDYKIKARTGFFLTIDDGLKAYILSFVDTDIGKFVGVAIRSGSQSFVEDVGTEGQAEKLSTKIDWSQPHNYRIERRPLDGLYVFIDDYDEPALEIPDQDRIDYPGSQFGAPTVAFGYLSSEGGEAKIDFVRTLFGSGYEISFRKIEDTSELEEDIRDAQAIIVAYAQDND